jgi:chemotaxis protein CheX
MPDGFASSARSVSVLDLPEVLDLKAAAPLASAFLERRGAEILVDASRVEKLGGQCLQVLLSAALTWKADETPFGIVDASSNFLDGLAVLGVPAGDLALQDLAR